jgi:triphosphatase
MSDTSHEIEKKILVSAKGMEELFKEFSKLAIDGEIKTKHRPRAYYDTKKRKLNRRRMALRVQHKGGTYEQTLKYEVPGGKKGAMSRVEVKDILGEKQETPDISLIDDKEAKKLLEGLEGKKLRHVFTADVHRRYFSIPVMQGGEEIGVVELAFDKGAVTHADRKDLSVKVSEIEVELKSGDPAAVDIICAKILKQAPEAKLSAVSKAEAGFRLDAEAYPEKKPAEDALPRHRKGPNPKK